MKWPILVGKARVQPTTGNWQSWKQQIADDCRQQCVYCAISEGQFGGIRNFHVEHFRPKSKFRELELRIENLYLACGICNVLKGDDWPGHPTNKLARLAYPDPRIHDYNQQFRIGPRSFEISGQSVAARYVVIRLLLNRPQLLRVRRLQAALRAAEEFRTWVTREMAEARSTRGRNELDRLMLKLIALLLELPTARPYRDVETKAISRRTVPKAERRPRRS